MFRLLRRLLALVLVLLGVASPWLVRDWLRQDAAATASGTGSLTVPAWIESLRERFSPDRTEPAVPEDASIAIAEVEPYPLAERTYRLIEGLFGHPPEPPAGPGASASSRMRAKSLAEAATRRLGPKLAEAGLKCGDPVVLRLFKEEGELEVWMKPSSDPLYTLFKIVRVTASAGRPGPKLREGDGQTPEGFYSITTGSLRPETRHHLGLDLGYPNEHDRALGRTGGGMLIHGGESAAGSFALSPAGIEEVYALVEAALEAGQERVPVHLFPFRLTDARMDRVVKERSPWTDHWINLKEGFDFFDNVRLPPATIPSGERTLFEIAAE